MDVINGRAQTCLRNMTHYGEHFCFVLEGKPLSYRTNQLIDIDVTKYLVGLFELQTVFPSKIWYNTSSS